MRFFVYLRRRKKISAANMAATKKAMTPYMSQLPEEDSVSVSICEDEELEELERSEEDSLATDEASVLLAVAALIEEAFSFFTLFWDV